MAAFGIYPSDNAGTNKATYARFVVTDFDAARCELLSRGVAFEEYDFGDDFRTVEGNILALGSVSLSRGTVKHQECVYPSSGLEISAQVFHTRIGEHYRHGLTRVSPSQYRLGGYQHVPEANPARA